jgi:hypothetical protein
VDSELDAAVTTVSPEQLWITLNSYESAALQSDYFSSFAVTLTIEFSLTSRSEVQSLWPCMTSWMACLPPGNFRIARRAATANRIDEYFSAVWIRCH